MCEEYKTEREARDENADFFKWDLESWNEDRLKMEMPHLTKMLTKLNLLSQKMTKDEQ